MSLYGAQRQKLPYIPTVLSTVVLGTLLMTSLKKKKKKIGDKPLPLISLEKVTYSNLSKGEESIHKI